MGGNSVSRLSRAILAFDRKYLPLVIARFNTSLEQFETQSADILTRARTKFDRFAETMDFDPLVPENWEKIAAGEQIYEKVGVRYVIL